MALSRRMFLRGGLAGSIVRIGLPPLAAMFNGSGTAYAAAGKTGSRAVESRFVLWFNGNGIPEKYWIPRETGQQPLSFHERAGIRPAIYGARRRRAIDRPGGRAEIGRGIALPVAAGRR